MPCLKCGSDLPDALRFRVLEVHTLHIRDFNGERIIQALGEFKNYEICTACALKGARAFLYPSGLILRKCFAFVMLAIAGVILSLAITFGESWPELEGVFAVKALGPIAVIAGLSGVIGRAREILRTRDEVRRMSHDEALRYSAYAILLENALKKYNDNDITYIPINKETLSMTPSQLAGKYDLLPAISLKACTGA